jgi:hypothetical protein
MARLTPEDFGTFFDSHFGRSAFRLERLNSYAVPEEAEPLRRFLAGEPQDPSWREPWARFVREAVGDGKRMARVHLVSEPLNEYLEFELTCGYPASVEAGEDVRILRPRGPHLTLPAHDYWLFDDCDVAIMIYDGDGGFVGAETTSVPTEVAAYKLARDGAMQQAVPLAAYLESPGMKEAV